MNVDYIVVGCGLAGVSFCEQLRTHEKSFVVFDNASQKSSTVAGGLYNPVVLKRFTPVWKTDEQLPLSLTMYQKLEKDLGVKLDYKLPVYRKFASLEEQNDWFMASDKPLLSEYLSPKIIKNNNSYIDAPFGFGEVLHTGKIDVKIMMDTYKLFLLERNQFFEEGFEYDVLQVSNKSICYKNIIAKHIIFAEGFGVKKNPFFNELPLVPAKGELLVIKAPELKIHYVLKGNVFLIPLENDLYTVGATYNWSDTTHKITAKAKDELLGKLRGIISCPFEVIGQVAGIRPTVKDRRPLVGSHEAYKNMFVLNGLGTRGVMIGPYVAKQLYDFIELNKPLDEEIDIQRFVKN